MGQSFGNRNISVYSMGQSFGNIFLPTDQISPIFHCEHLRKRTPLKGCVSRDFLTFFTKQNLKCFKIDKNHKAKLFIILIMLKGLNAVFNIKYCRTLPKNVFKISIQ